MKAKVPFAVTPIIYDNRLTSLRLFQCQENGRMIPVPVECYDIIDTRELEHDGAPMGPSAETSKGSIMIWKNDCSALSVCRADISESGLPVLEILAGLEYEEVPV